MPEHKNITAKAVFELQKQGFQVLSCRKTKNNGLILTVDIGGEAKNFLFSARKKVRKEAWLRRAKLLSLDGFIGFDPINKFISFYFC